MFMASVLLPLPQFSVLYKYPRRSKDSNFTRAVSNFSNSINTNQFLPRISSLCESGNLNESFRIIQEFAIDNDDKSLSNSLLLVKEALGLLLQASGKRKDIKTGRKIHQMVFESNRLRSDDILCTRIITMYAMCGSPDDSRLVFDDLPRKNLFQWNAVISSYSRNELYHDVLEMFVKMISKTDFLPDNFTFPCVIKAFAGVSDVEIGFGVHGFVVKTGLVEDVFVGNALVSFYGTHGFVSEAYKLFDIMPERNLVSWNTMIRVFSDYGFSEECFLLVGEMMDDGVFMPDVATLVTVLPVCARDGDIGVGRGVHGVAVKLGLDKELVVNNALMDMYSKCCCVTDAQMIFKLNNNKNVISWNTMIGGFSAEGNIHGTFDLLRRMVSGSEEDVEPDEVSILNALPVCFDESVLLSLKELHCYSLKQKFVVHNELVANAFVSSYAKCGSLSYAQRVFHGIRNKTVNSWNALINGYSKISDPRLSLNAYLQMKISGFLPDSFTICSLLSACSQLKSLRLGKEVHGYVIRNRLERDLFVYISILSLYIHCGELCTAQILFEAMEDKSLVSWNTVINCYIQNGYPERALSLFRQMVLYEIRPCELSIASVFNACSILPCLRLGREAHAYTLKHFLERDEFIACSMIDMYAKNGSITESYKVFNGLKEKALASWNAMIMGYGIYGLAKEAIKLFEEMLRTGLNPDEFSFLGVLTACNHSGLINEGLRYLDQMKSSFRLKPSLKHYACVIDMLGRAGELDKALRFVVEEMSEEPDIGIWNSLLSSCRIHQNLEMGEKLAEKLFVLEPEKPENYVLLSNLYAALGKWDDVRKVRQRMKEMSLQKDGGCSWIELNGKVYNSFANES